jgi:hypothetical protein
MTHSAGVSWQIWFAILSAVFLLISYVGLQATTAIGQGPSVQVVSPGRSIQAAVDRAPTGGWVYVLPGVYRETADATNGLNITKPINLVGLSTSKKRPRKRRRPATASSWCPKIVRRA